jgi:hypothetical protein
VAEIYTVPGLFLGLIGVAGMAWRDRIILPVAVVIAHFAFGSLLPPFGQYNRTAAYLLPMLMLGEGWLIVAGFRYLISQRHFGWRRTTGIGLLVVLVLTAVIRQAAIEYSRIENPSTVVHWGKLIGEAVWRPIISQIEASIPDGGTLLPWDYGLSHQFRSLSERDGQELRVLRPLETMLIHREAGTLRQYIETRGLTISEKHPIFVLAPADITPKMLNRNLQSVFDEKGFALQALPFATPRLMWKLPPAKYYKIGLRLFEIDWR